MASLRDKTLSSIFWSFLQKVGSRGIQFFVTIILVRLLTPADFGLIGMLSIFIALSQTIVQAGFRQALIQKKDTDEEDFSSVFWINLAVSILIYIILFFTAPLIAEFYHQPKLVSLTRVLALIFVINSFGYVQESRLEKQMDFKKLMYIHLPSTFLSGAVGVIMAFKGFGVWSLVGQQLTMQVVFVVQLWIYSKWVPMWTFNRAKAGRLFSFGSKLMISGVVHTIADNLYQITIGKFFPVQMLGYYENADKLTKTPTGTISSVLNSVAFPAFSQIQDNNEKLREGYKKIMQQVLFWLTPILIMGAILAEPLFHFLFGEKWLPAVPFFQILCVTRVFSPLSSYNLNLINVKGRSDIYLKLEIIKKTFLAIGVAIAIPLGIFALVYFKLIYGIVVYFVNSYYSGKFIGYPTKAQIKDILPIFALTAVMGVVVFGLNLFAHGLSGPVRVVLGSAAGISIFWILSHITQLGPYIEFRAVMAEKFLKKIKK